MTTSILAADRGGAATSTHARAIDVAAVQRRTLRVLVAVQVLAGLGVATAVAIGTLLAARLFGSAGLAGLAQSSLVLGSALFAVPAATVSARLGRRIGMTGALSIAVLGGLVAVTAAQAHQFWLLVLGMGMLGGGGTATLQGRYAAIDLARPERRGRTLSVIVWTTVIGSTVGPNLAGPGARLSGVLGVEPLAGPLLVGTAAVALAASIAWKGLRPDPLLLARALAGPAPEGKRRVTTRSGWQAIRRSPAATFAVVAALVANAAMVTVMVMTPVHMDHGHASLSVIGVVISIHIAGMYAFAPVMGWLSDRFGRVPVINGAALTLLSATALCGLAPSGHSPMLTTGLFLLGLGWSAATVASSTLLSESVPEAERPVAQGTSDLLMGLAAAGGGAFAGLIMSALGYGLLNLAAALIVLPLLVLARPRPSFGRHMATAARGASRISGGSRIFGPVNRAYQDTRAPEILEDTTIREDLEGRGSSLPA